MTIFTVDTLSDDPSAGLTLREALAPADGPVFEEILDFNRGQVDKSDLRTIDANQGAAGNQPFHFIGAALFGPAQRHVEASNGDFLIAGSTDADAAAEFALVVHTGIPGLKVSDFLLQIARQGSISSVAG